MEFNPVHANSDYSQPLESLLQPSLQVKIIEAQFAVVVENMAEAFFALDLTASCTYLNQKAERLFKDDRNHLIGKTLGEIFQVDTTSQLYQLCHQAAIEKLPAFTEFEEFYESLNQWFAVRLLPIPGGVSAYFQDISKRKNTETELRKEQEFLRVLLDNVQAGIVACDGEGQLKLFNKAARSFHGMSEQPLPPEQWADHYDLYLPDGKTLMSKEDIPLYRALQGEQLQNVEMTIAPKQGTPKLLLASGQAIYHSDGEKQGAVVVMHDITKQRETENALRESEAQLSSIFQTIPDGIMILNRNGQIIAANSAAEVILKLSRSKITERVYNDPSWSITTVDGQPFPEDELPFVQVMRTGKPVYGVEHAIAHSQGKKTILSVNACPLFDAEGCITNVIAAICDITERKQAEVYLRESEQRYRSVIETAAEGIVLQQTDGSIFTCNASAERILGITASQMMGLTSVDPLWCSIHEDGSPFPGEQHPAMVTLRTGEPQSNVIMGIRKPEGTITWISINSRPLFQPNETKPYAAVSSFFDITDLKQTEEALRKTEQRYRSVVDHVKEVIFQTDATGLWTFLNPAWTEITGFSVAESLETPFLNYVHPDNRQRHLALFQPLLQQKQESCRYEIRFLTKSGDSRWIEVFARLMLEDDGTILGTSGTLNDITEGKKADEERVRLIQEQTARSLAETAQHRSEFLAQMSEVLASSLSYEQTLQTVASSAVPYFADWCAVDLLNDDGTISRVAVAHSNPKKVELGWELAQRFPRCLDDGYGISQVMKTGQSEIAIAISDQQLITGVPNFEYLEILRGLGLKSCISAPLTARGRVLGSITFVFAESNRHYAMEDLELAEDLARRAAIAIDNAHLYHTAQQAKQAAEAAADRTARLQMVTAALSESLTPVQVAEVIVEQSIAALEADAALMALVNKEGTAIEIVRAVGYPVSSEEIKQQFPLSAPVPLAEAIRTGQPIWSEPLAQRLTRYPNLADAYKRLNFQAWISLPLMVERKAVGGLSISFKKFKRLSENDREFVLALTRQCAQAIFRAQLFEAERSARAKAEQANRVKDEFLAVLSHELRSPLNPILGWSKLLQHQQHNPTVLIRGLKTIERNARLQTQLIEDLLDVSRILRGKLSLDITPVDLKSTIEGAIETVQLAAEAKVIQIESQFETNVGYVLGDASRLQQIVWNLLSNAVKFTPQGGQVQITLKQVNSQVQIEVSDTGLGITPEFLPYIFDRFRQADSKTTRKFGGLGLGLAIVQELVELHGGTVQADSPGEGQGSKFTVKLPLSGSQESGLGDGENDAYSLLSAPRSPLTNLRILVVDDETDARELLVFILEEAGASITSVGSAIEALQALKDMEIDVLISDIGMPEMDGYMLIQQMRSEFSALNKSLPKAIALTAYAGLVNQQQASAAGFQLHLAKPVEPDKLINAIVNLKN
jgi:PAS domain S-box-containing protein